MTDAEKAFWEEADQAASVGGCSIEEAFEDQDIEQAKAWYIAGWEKRGAAHKVRLKSQKAFKKLVRSGEIELLGVSDDGEVTHYGTKGNPSHILTVWWDSYGDEYLVVDHENPISKDSYEMRKVFFEEIPDSPDSPNIPNTS